MSPHPLLAVNDLSIELNTRRQKTLLVSDVSFQIAPQKVMGLIGESGCGKSLTCLAITGLLPPNIMQVGGEICLEGQDLSGLKVAHQRPLRGKKIAMVLQNPSSCFDSVFTIRHHFKETLNSHGNYDAKQIEQASLASLAEVGFEAPEEILGLYPFQMSGGMLQRVMLALAIMMEVSLLIADEPTTDLDLVSQARVLDLLSELGRKYGLALLLVTHDLSVIARLADHVAVMKSGAIVESGPVETLFNAAEHAYTRAIMDAHLSLYGNTLSRLLSPASEAHRSTGTFGR